MIKLPEKYDAKTREKFWQNYWREKKIYKWLNDKSKSETFVIDTPPPTVSGLLHMGHVFSYSQADFVARFQRMSGKDVFYPMGFDDNGLPTERLVEKIIGKKAGIYEAENGHGSFVKKCREIVEDAEKEFEALFNEIALSVDWEQKYQTISPESQKISQASFIDLFHKKMVERKAEPVFWDISDRTALAQADLVDKEVEGVMNYIWFGVEGSDEDLVQIMTTRPELLPACVAVMINPDHKKEDGTKQWEHLIKKPLNENGEGFTGTYLITPLFGVKVPLFADKLVQTDKGTGAVMCCTFGDETDIKWWRKYGLKTRIILTKNGTMEDIGTTAWLKAIKRETPFNSQDIWSFNNDKPKGSLVFEMEGADLLSSDEFAILYEKLVKGKKIKDAKEAIIKELQSLNLNLGPTRIEILEQKNLPKRPVKCAERSGVPIEILVVPQWFIKILDEKELLKAKADECNWFPDYMRVRVEQWIDGLSWDWCISRQRFFGVKFPIWYSKRAGEEGKILVAEIEQLPCDPEVDLPRGYHRDEVIPETDIMDTWATSSVSPQLSSRAINEQIHLGNLERHQKLFPADLRPQAHEIIRTWAFYTLVKSALHQNSVPWKNLMISGWCLAADKTKMSKSKGNVVTPTALIEEKGSDIVRYWASTSHLGADTAYSEEVFKIGQKLITKLFNAAKFASMNFGLLKNEEAALGLSQKEITEPTDLWALSRLQQTIKCATKEFEKFEYARAREAIEEFFWKDFCDNYLEICKVRSYGLSAEKLAGVELTDAQKIEISAKQKSAILTLRFCLNTILKLFAPFIPHICDEIYSAVFAEEFAQKLSINARGNWPKFDENFFNEELMGQGKSMLEVIFEVRKFKSEKNISMKSSVKKILISGIAGLENFVEDLRNVCNAEEIELCDGERLVKVIQ